MATASMPHGSSLPSFGKLASLALTFVRMAFMLIGPVGLLALAIVVRYAVFEYFHGSEQTLRAVWHALRP